jgi:methyl-accepting chemotaxis protein
MKWFYDLKISAKLIGAFIFVGAITALVGCLGINSMGTIADMAASSYAKETLGISYLRQADTEVVEAARAEKNLLLASTPEEQKSTRRLLIHSLRRSMSLCRKRDPSSTPTRAKSC